MSRSLKSECFLALLETRQQRQRGGVWVEGSRKPLTLQDARVHPFASTGAVRRHTPQIQPRVGANCRVGRRGGGVTGQEGVESKRRKREVVNLRRVALRARKLRLGR
jgi:hypothetical protein